MERALLLLMDGNKWPRSFVVREYLDGYGNNLLWEEFIFKSYQVESECANEIGAYLEPS